MDQVGRYQILEELGRGAHGVVYKALDPAIGRTIAIKAIAIGDMSSADRERVREGILGEARLAGTLSHPSIVTVYDVVDSDNAIYIVMEFVDGDSLENAITSVRNSKPGLLTRGGFLSIFKQVALALDYAHRKGVIHRDVKPANIVLTGQRAHQTGELIAKIADFGVAKFTSHDKTEKPGAPPQLVGTPNYMSPEQVEGVSLGGASDQFSLAVIAYEVLTGKKAFAADSLEALLYRIRHEPEEPVNALNADLSATVAKVMQRALAKLPADRFTTCGEFAGALEFALGDCPRWSPGALDEAVNHTQKPATWLEEEIPETKESSVWARKLVLLLALCIAAGVALVLVVKMNSGPTLPSQVLETQGAPVSSPPNIDELKEDRHTAAAPSHPIQAHAAGNVQPPIRSAEPVAKPVAVEPPRKKPIPIKQVRQVTIAAVPGEVQISTDPPAASVTVDAVNSCSAPCSFTLNPGRHTLSASLSGFAVAHKIFNVPQDLNLFVPLVKSVGVLFISSDPSGATANVDGQPAGQTPLTVRLQAGSHRVSVWDGARWHDAMVQVTGDEVHTQMFKLNPF